MFGIKPGLFPIVGLSPNWASLTRLGTPSKLLVLPVTWLKLLDATGALNWKLLGLLFNAKLFPGFWLKEFDPEVDENPEFELKPLGWVFEVKGTESTKTFGLCGYVWGFFLWSSKACQLMNQNGCLSIGSLLSRSIKSLSPLASIGNLSVVPSPKLEIK